MPTSLDVAPKCLANRIASAAVLLASDLDGPAPEVLLDTLQVAEQRGLGVAWCQVHEALLHGPQVILAMGKMKVFHLGLPSINVKAASDTPGIDQNLQRGEELKNRPPLESVLVMVVVEYQCCVLTDLATLCVILNGPERIKTQPHDDRDNCFLHFDSKGPLRYDSEQ